MFFRASRLWIGSGAPADTFGSLDDFWLDVDSDPNQLYGPKGVAVWPDAIDFGGSGGGASLSNADPFPLAPAASPGTDGRASRADHQHVLPFAADIGAASADDLEAEFQRASAAEEDLGATDAGLQSSINAEGVTRAAGDATNAAAISAEATARGLAISAEATARTAAINAAISALVNGAPGALDTLKELADAINDDASFAASVTTALAGKVPTTRTVNGHALSADVTVSKSDVGLANADNTSDAAKPISTATQAALDLKANTSDAVAFAVALGG